MNQEKIAKLIKQIRLNNNLTQKEFADKYNLTSQAVSKWERGINLPDISLLQQISKDYKISIDDILKGTINKKKSNKKIIIIITIIIIIATISSITIIKKHIIKESSFNFKILSSNCKDFNISGNIAYNNQKSSIYITNIQYCGGNDTELYTKIECSLYETNNNIEKKISTNNYDNNESITLEKYLQTVTFSINDYQKLCKDYQKNSLYLLINALNDKGITTSYKIPLSLDQNCNNYNSTTS